MRPLVTLANLTLRSMRLHTALPGARKALQRGAVHPLALTALVAALSLYGSTGYSDPPKPGSSSREHDHNRAKNAVKAGEILPLSTVLDIAAKAYPGKVLEVELEYEHERWVYEFKILQANGVVLKLYLDAKDGSLVKKKLKDSKS